MTRAIALVGLFILAAPSWAGQGTSPAPAALKGTLERIKVHGKSLEGNLMKETAAPEVSIYLPPELRHGPQPALSRWSTSCTATPTRTSATSARPDASCTSIAERVFGAGSAKEMILVMPNCMNAYGGCMYSNSVTAGDWEGYVADDLVAYMDSHYRTLATRASRGLAGHSMGGYGTLRIAMKRPDVFSAIYALSSCCLNEGTVRPPRDGAPSPAESVKSVEEAQGQPRRHRARWRAPPRGRPTPRTRRSISTCRPGTARCSRRGGEVGGEFTGGDARSVRREPEEVQGDRARHRPAATR